MKTLSHPGLETVGLEIRSLNGKDALFTTDGKLLANQGETGHIYYVRDDRGRRYKTFRASFLVDNESVTLQGPYEHGTDTQGSDLR